MSELTEEEKAKKEAQRLADIQVEIANARKRLEEGNARFISDKLDGQLQDSARRDHLTGGQSPFAVILSCADSRVVPELAFDTGLGELFVLRVAGNVANTSTIASIEYAIAHLDTRVIVVMGHESCGAVGAAMDGGDNGHNLNHLLAHITPALCAAEEGATKNDIVKSNAKLNAKELHNRSGIISNAVNGKELEIWSAYYNLDSGKVDFI
ncbi:MAG: carbonic anhydrase [Crocinitomix sp.]|jgi:carbonic anhydrase